MILGFLAGFLAAWNLAGYPLFLMARGRSPGIHWRPGAWPKRISVLVAAHDEADVIGARVRNLRAQEDAGDVEILVVADGCDDDTASRARDAGATVIEQARAGKVAALHAAVARSTGDVLVLTDANTRFEPDTLRRLIAPLADDRVGIAAGDLQFERTDEACASAGENTYWRYETVIKQSASRCGLLLMGAGGVYAVRRADWPMAMNADLADDSYVPLSLHRAGRINVFVPEARAWERAGATMREEWRRRVRMVAQDMRVAVALNFGWPNRRTVFALVSQKVIRWFLFPLGVIVVRAFVPRRVWLPAISLLAIGGVRRIPVISTVAYLIGATAAAFLGAVLGLSGRSPATWARAASTRCS